MTVPYFKLSSRQRKQLLERGAVVRVAIPLPLEWPELASDHELRCYVVKMLLEDVEHPAIQRVEETMVAVIPLSGKDPTGSGILGKIIGDASSRNRLHLTVSVVIADLCVEETPRNSPTRIQWPGDVSMFFQKDASE